MLSKLLKPIAAGGVAVVAGLTLVACGSSGGGAASRTTSAKQGTSNPGAAIPGNTLTVGIVVDPPFILRTPTGQWTSLAPALDRKFAAYLHKKIKFVPTGFTTAIAGLQADKFEMFGADYHATPEREKVVTFSTPYNMSGTTFWVKKNNPQHISTVADLNSSSVTIAITTGSDNETAAKKYVPKAHETLLPNPTIADLVLQLESGRATAFAESSYLVQAFRAKYPNFTPIPNNTSGLISQGQGWCFNKNEKALIAAANAFMAKEIKSGDLAALKKKYITVKNAEAAGG